MNAVLEFRSEVLKKGLTLLTAMLLMILSAAYAQQSEYKNYTVHYTVNPPRIDGVLSPGEWNQAAPPQGDFRTLQKGRPASHQYRLQALWDDQHLYIGFWCSDTMIPSQEGFPGDDAINTWPGFIFKDQYEDVEFLFDPGNIQENRAPGTDTNDCYHIAVQLVNGMRRAGTSQPPYLFTAARYNSLFQGISWNPTDIAVGVNINNGITVEMTIPFSNLNQRYGAFHKANLGESDLEINGPPQPGSQWAFQVARHMADGPVVLWNFHPGYAIAQRPFGIFTFVKETGKFSNQQNAFQSQNPFSAPSQNSASGVASPFESKPPLNSSQASPGNQGTGFNPFSQPPAKSNTPSQAITGSTTSSPFVTSQRTPVSSINSSRSTSPFNAQPGQSSLPPYSTSQNQPPFATPGNSQPVTGKASPFNQPQQATSPASSPFNQPVTARNTPPDASWIDEPRKPASTSMTPSTSQQPFGASPAISATPVSNVYTDLDAGKRAIRTQQKPGIVFLTNPREADNQRIARILETPQYRQVLDKVILITVDVSENKDALTRYALYKTPSIVLYDSKGRMRKKLHNVSDVTKLLAEINQLQ